jgi:hypothetical protein
MLRNIFLSILTVVSLTTFVNAQDLIAVKGASKNGVFRDIKAAYDFADAGDNIYLPGGQFRIPFDITKKVNIIGVGYNPKYAGASGITTINSDVNFQTGADGSSITGVYVNGILRLGGANNLTARRCNALEIWMGTDNDEITVTECVARQQISMSKNPTYGRKYILNSIFPLIRGYNDMQIATIKNNIFLAFPSRSEQSILWITEGSVENNIFLQPYDGSGAINLVTPKVVFRNNIFVCPKDKVDFRQGNWEEGNQFGVDINQLCVSVSDPTVFKSSFDFHLKANSPARMGTETNEQDDAGIYGGILPWKDGGLPPNPHIETNNTAFSATGNKLQLKMKVKAQNN